MFPLKLSSGKLELELANMSFSHRLFVLNLFSTKSTPDTWSTAHLVFVCVSRVFGTEGDGCFWQMYRIKVALLSFYPQGVSFSDKGSGEVNRNFSLSWNNSKLQYVWESYLLIVKGNGFVKLLDREI